MTCKIQANILKILNIYCQSHTHRPKTGVWQQPYNILDKNIAPSEKIVLDHYTRQLSTANVNVYQQLQ